MLETKNQLQLFQYWTLIINSKTSLSPRLVPLTNHYSPISLLSNQGMFKYTFIKTQWQDEFSQKKLRLKSVINSLSKSMFKESQILSYPNFTFNSRIRTTIREKGTSKTTQPSTFTKSKKILISIWRQDLIQIDRRD